MQALAGIDAVDQAIGPELLDASADARDYFIGHNVVALLAANQIGQVDYFSLAPRDSPPASELPDPAVAVLVLGAYCLGFLAIAFWVFRRRDIHA